MWALNWSLNDDKTSKQPQISEQATKRFVQVMVFSMVMAITDTNENSWINTQHHASYTCPQCVYSHWYLGKLAPTLTFVGWCTSGRCTDWLASSLWQLFRVYSINWCEQVITPTFNWYLKLTLFINLSILWIIVYFTGWTTEKIYPCSWTEYKTYFTVAYFNILSQQTITACNGRSC